jgi:predicted metal-dependent phosphoesterase TrpH
MTELYDLHCHSTASDGVLSPSELIQRAELQGVTVLALTDHDTTAGLKEAQLATTRLKLIAGIEMSTSWQGKCFHILGLNIDPQFQPLIDALDNVQNIRHERAIKIAEKLEKKHIYGALAAIKKIVGDGLVTRTHFADFLVSQNHVSTRQEAFDRYLGEGKSCFIACSSSAWLELETAVHCIKASGGVPVVAHPLRYQLTASWIKRFLTAFKEAGGQGMEVVTGRYNPDDMNTSANYARKFELAGSQGSDFHCPDQWVELGKLAPLPVNIKPVWELFV